MELTEIMYMAVDEPETVHLVLEKTTRFLTDYIQAFKKAGAHGIVMAEPAASLLSPDWNAEFSASYVRQIVSAVQDENFIVVYHNCGNVLPLLPEIVETGAAAFHFDNSISMKDAIEKIPADRLVMGNIESATLIACGTPASVYEATKALAGQMKDYPNFVLSSGCDIPPQAPLENIDAFFAAAKAV